MITINVNDLNEANLILTALGELPCKHVFDLVTRVRNQVQEQVVPPPPPPPGDPA